MTTCTEITTQEHNAKNPQHSKQKRFTTNTQVHVQCKVQLIDSVSH